MNVGTRAAALLVFGGLVAAVANAARPKPLEWIWDQSQSIKSPDVAKKYSASMDEVRTNFQNSSAQFIDARGADQFALSHLRGAYSLPSTEIEQHMQWLFQNVATSQLAIIYCDGGDCEASDRVFEYLKAARFTNLKIFRDGWKVLGPSDLPKETGEWQAPAIPGMPGPADGGAPPDGAGAGEGGGS